MALAQFRKCTQNRTAPQSARDALTAYNRLLKASVIQEHPDPSDRRQRVAEDSRTVTVDGVQHITPVFASDTNVFIICPYCGGIHIHGNVRGSDYSGHRAPHCMGTSIQVKDYFIGRVE